MDSDSAAGQMLRSIFGTPAEPGPPYTHTLDLTPPGPAGAVKWLRSEIESDLGRARYILDKRGAHPDPRREMHDAVADCEAKLAILDEHRPEQGRDESDGDLTLICWVCVDDRMYGYPYPCKTVRLLAAGYRHREGYAGHWGTPPMYTITQA